MISLSIQVQGIVLLWANFSRVLLNLGDLTICCFLLKPDYSNEYIIENWRISLFLFIFIKSIYFDIVFTKRSPPIYNYSKFL
jgi:hypothetical protein